MNKRTNKSVKVNKNFMIVAIDIGKDTNHACVYCTNGYEVQPFSFRNRRAGFDKLWSEIVSAKKKANAAVIRVGFESTGPYGIPLIHYLDAKPVELVQVNPMHTKRVKELSDNSPLKHDKKDPTVIADIMRLGHFLSVIIPKGTAAELRHLTHARERAVRDRTVIVHRLNQLIFQIFPEFIDVMHGIESVSAHSLLRQYPTPDKLIKLGYDKLTAMLERISRKQLGTERAHQLLSAAKHSVGVMHGRMSILIEIEHFLDQIQQKNEYIAHLENTIKQLLATIPLSRNILSIPGIGPITAAVFFGETGDITAVRTQRSIVKLAGLNLFEISSGKRKGERHISKRGRGLFRKILFLASVNLIRKNGIMHTYYHKLLERGKPKKSALLAVSKKLLCLMFALVRRNELYNHTYAAKHAA